MRENKRGITLIALIISIIVLVILAGVAINTLYGENGIITTTQDVAVLSNIKSLEESIDLYKIGKNLEGKIEEDSYPIALNEDGSRITLSQMRDISELESLADEVKYALLNLTAEKGTTNIPTFDQIDYNKFYKLDYTKLNISQEEAKNLVIYVDGDNYKVINLAGVKYKKNNIYVIIPLNNESEPEYITVANNTYKLYGDGTLKVLGEKTVNSGYTSSEVNTINNSWDEFDLKAINEKFNNRMNLPETLTNDWYASHVYFSTGTVYVIDQNNDLWAWGANGYNKLGLGHSFLVVEPTKILEKRCEGKEDVKASKVWAGIYNTFIVDTDGTLWVCGTNSSGTLGQSNYKNYSKWVKVDYINGNEIKEIQVSFATSQSAAIIKMKDGSVYVSGWGIGFGLKESYINKFTKAEEYDNLKQIEISGTQTYYLNQSNILYVVGWGVQTNMSNGTLDNAVKISEKVKEISSTYGGYILFINEDNELYLYNYTGTLVKINGININDTTILLNGHSLINNGDYYKINDNGSAEKENNIINIEPYYNKNDEYRFLGNRSMSVRADNKKIFIQKKPDITKIGEKSNYNLRKVFKDVIFVQGKGNYISIADRNGKIYESITSKANTTIDSARKIIASSRSKYIIKSDGTLWAKGHGNTGMWGIYDNKDNYVQITKDGTNNFTNIKDIYTSKNGANAIFITDDNKIYWAGSDIMISLPQVKGDYVIVGSGRITNYPKEVTSTVIEQIRNKIKDIEYSFVNDGGIYGSNTLILTEDGSLYTMADNKNMSGNNSLKYNDSGDFTELIIKEGTTVKQVLTEDGFSLALLSNGEVYGWGYNTYGILGPNYEVGGIYPTPVKIEGLPANIRYMSLGNGFAIFASKSGEVYGIGKNDYGQLGTGDSIGRTEFVRCTKLEE